MSNPNEVVKRFDLKFSNYKSEYLGESEHGGWVKYSDFHRFETLADTLADNYNAKHKQVLELLEKVQSLELENKLAVQTIAGLSVSLAESKEENKRLREALEKIDARLVQCGMGETGVRDIAKQALENKEV